VPKPQKNMTRSKAAAIDHAARCPQHGASPAGNANTAVWLRHGVRPSAGGRTADAAVTCDRWVA